MHYVVCVKMVPDTTQVTIDPVTNTLVREGVPFITNPFDNHAVEEALRLKEKYGGHITAISMGPPAADAVLKKAMALGVDEAILLSDRVFGGADTLATSLVLSEAIRKLDKQDPVDIVLCGKQTIDGDTAQVGPGIACRLKYSQLTLVDRVLEIHKEKRLIIVRRAMEEMHEIVESRMPVLMTVVREANVPRYPTVPGRLDAIEAKVPIWTNDVLKMDPNTIGLKGSPTQVRRIFAPQRDKGEIVEGDGEKLGHAVGSVFKKLMDWDFISLEK